MLVCKIVKKFDRYEIVFRKNYSLIFEIRNNLNVFRDDMLNNM